MLASLGALLRTRLDCHRNGVCFSGPAARRSTCREQRFHLAIGRKCAICIVPILGRAPFNKFTRFDMRTTESESDFGVARRSLTTSTPARARALRFFFFWSVGGRFVRRRNARTKRNKTLHNLLLFLFF